MFGLSFSQKISKITFSLLHINQSLFLSPLSFSITFSLTHIYSNSPKISNHPKLPKKQLSQNIQPNKSKKFLNSLPNFFFQKQLSQKQTKQALSLYFICFSLSFYFLSKNFLSDFWSKHNLSLLFYWRP